MQPMAFGRRAYGARADERKRAAGGGERAVPPRVRDRERDERDAEHVRGHVCGRGPRSSFAARGPPQTPLYFRARGARRRGKSACRRARAVRVEHDQARGIGSPVCDVPLYARSDECADFVTLLLCDLGCLSVGHPARSTAWFERPCATRSALDRSSSWVGRCRRPEKNTTAANSDAMARMRAGRRGRACRELLPHDLLRAGRSAEYFSVRPPTHRLTAAVGERRRRVPAFEKPAPILKSKARARVVNFYLTSPPNSAGGEIPTELPPTRWASGPSSDQARRPSDEDWVAWQRRLRLECRCLVRLVAGDHLGRLLAPPVAPSFASHVLVTRSAQRRSA